ncbi:hypothetical protein AQ616_18810 [Oceanobacillus sp. E9]|uniref:hypothetical protein n=1 Tax=Oceanobacillus sp. E9 TaxID=1742575 RepID=UPI00084E54B8|nr:hypothetical protein [Oceanobacillus sp. E9]OEH52957.1 hypothetical protein AQ616_18810 [Oceanobacillus sp. E9]
MQIMTTYLDMCTEIELIKDQIQIVKREINYWFGIDLDTNEGVPLSGKGADKFGVMASLHQAEKKIESFQLLTKRLTQLEREKGKMDELMDKFEGLDYKIAYKRIVESKTHQEVADELGYSHQYIKERWLKIKTYKEHTENLVKL